MLVAGITHLSTPFGVRRIDVASALEMRDAVLAEFERRLDRDQGRRSRRFPTADGERSGRSRRKTSADGGSLTLELVQNPDILAEICARKGDRTIVGFAAESHDVVAAAQRKLARKGCDLIVANDISRADAGFEVDENAVLFVWPDGEVEELPLLLEDRASRPSCSIASRSCGRRR